MPVSKQWVLRQRAKPGMAVEDLVRLREEPTPELRRDEVLCRGLFLSVDPVVRLHMAYGLGEGDVVPGRQVARVVDSRNRDFPKGKLVVGAFGWQTYTVLNPNTAVQHINSEEVSLVQGLPPQLECSGGLPKSACLGVLGVPGLMAYLGLLHKCRAKEGETVVISSAAGQVGHVAGQIAKFMGLKVIGYAGDADKASWIKTELGFDWAFNRRTQQVDQTLKIAAPTGVDVFLDSVGGSFHSAVMRHMRPGGRVCIYGNLSLYEDPGREPREVPAYDLAVAVKGLSVFGFGVHEFPEARREEALDQLADWCRDGYVEPREHVVEGFEAVPAALAAMLAGESSGKVIVRV